MDIWCEEKCKRKNTNFLISECLNIKIERHHKQVQFTKWCVCVLLCFIKPILGNQCTVQGFLDERAKGVRTCHVREFLPQKRNRTNADEVELSFISWIWIHESDFKGFFLEKGPWKGFSIKCSNSGINKSTPQTRSNVILISSKAELEISFLNSVLEKCHWPPPHNQIYSRNWYAFSMLKLTKFPPQYGGGFTFYYTKHFLNRFIPYVYRARPTHGPWTSSKKVRIWPKIEYK